MAAWQTLASRTVYENPWIRLREDEVIRPDGSDALYGVVEIRHPAVFVVPVTDADEVVLIRTFRYTTDRESIEIPAGGTDGDEPLDAARRELREAGQLVGTVIVPVGVTTAVRPADPVHR